METRLIQEINIGKKFDILELNIPEGITILPHGLENAESLNDLYYFSDAYELKELFEQKNISGSSLLKDYEYLPEERRSLGEFILPTIFVTGSLLSENPNMVSVALNVVSDYLVDLFKGFPKSPDRKIKFKIILEKKKRSDYRMMEITGEVSDFENLDSIIEKVFLKE